MATIFTSWDEISENGASPSGTEVNPEGQLLGIPVNREKLVFCDAYTYLRMSIDYENDPVVTIKFASHNGDDLNQYIFRNHADFNNHYCNKLVQLNYEGYRIELNFHQIMLDNKVTVKVSRKIDDENQYEQLLTKTYPPKKPLTLKTVSEYALPPKLPKMV